MYDSPDPNNRVVGDAAGLINTEYRGQSIRIIIKYYNAGVHLQRQLQTCVATVIV